MELAKCTILLHKYHAEVSNDIPPEIMVDGYLKESMAILEDYIELKNGQTSKL